MADAVHEITAEYEINSRIYGVTCDNASANDTMCLALSKKEDMGWPLDLHIRCLAHIMNLAAQIAAAVLAPSVAKEAVGLDLKFKALMK